MEPPILVYRVTDPWGWNDFYRSTQEGRQMREASGAPYIHIIIDTTDMRRPPNGALTHLGNMFRHGSPSTSAVRLVVMVGASGFVRAIMDLLTRLSTNAARKLRYADTLEDAYTLLRAIPEAVEP
jgi:hypothetical protein